MTDRSRIESALRAAHSAGDAELAQRLASELGRKEEQSIGGRIGEFFTGNLRNPNNYGEISQSTYSGLNDGGEGDQASGGIPFLRPGMSTKLAAFGSGPLSEAAIFKDQNPGEEIVFDNDGLPMVVTNEGPLYLNKPGMSSRDVTDGITDFVAPLMVARGAGKLAQGSGLMGRGAAVGSAEFSAEVGRQAVGQGYGSDEPIDLKRAAVLGALGMGGEIVGPLAIDYFGNIFANNRFVKNGTLTNEGYEAVAKSGMNPDLVDQDFISLFSNASDGAASARAANAGSIGMPITTGQATRDATQQTVERRAADGIGVSSDVGASAKEFFEQQPKILRENLESISPIQATIGEGAESLQDSIRADYSSRRSAVNDAYDAAKQSQAFAPQTVIAEIYNDSVRVLSDEAFDYQSGVIAGELRKLENLSKALNGKPADVSLNGIEAFRKSLNRKISDGTDINGALGSDSVGLIEIKKQLDSKMQDLFETSAIYGDEGALDAWKKARSLRAEMGSIYGNPETVLNKIAQRDLTPEEVSRLFFNLNDTGIKVPKTIEHIKEVFGAESPQFLGLKQEYFLRLVNSVDGEISPAKLNTALTKAFRNQNSGMNVLFTREEMLKLRKIAFAADTIKPMAGTTGSAGSSRWNAMNSARELSVMFGPMGRWVSALGSRLFKEAGNDAKTALGLSGQLEKVSFAREGYSGGATAGAGNATLD